jgi:hypothetical protein
LKLTPSAKNGGCFIIAHRQPATEFTPDFNSLAARSVTLPERRAEIQYLRGAKCLRWLHWFPGCGGLIQWQVGELTR